MYHTYCHHQKLRSLFVLLAVGHISLDFFDYDRIISLDFFNSYQIICLDYFFFVSLQRENS